MGGFQWYGWPALFLGTLATCALVERGDGLLGDRTLWRARASDSTQ